MASMTFRTLVQILIWNRHLKLSLFLMHPILQHFLNYLYRKEIEAVTLQLFLFRHTLMEYCWTNQPSLTRLHTNYLPPQNRHQHTRSLNQASKKYFHSFCLESSWQSASIFLFLCFISLCEGPPFRPPQSPLHYCSQIFLPPTPFHSHCGEDRFPFLTEVLYNFSLHTSRFTSLPLQLRTPWKDKCDLFFPSQHVITYSSDMVCSIFTVIFVLERD